MPRYAQLVMGPAGSGKSTYCSNMVTHCEVLHQTVHVVNLDPAAEKFDYPVLADVRELISLEDVMEDEEMCFGPNGGLIFCLEYLTQNFDWLYEQIDDIDDDYIIFDCPGQIELYTHIPVMKQLVDQLHQWDFRVCGVFLVDSQFMIEASKFVAGVTAALSTMVNLEITHVNVMSKIDLLSTKARKELERYLEPNMQSLLNDEFEDTNFSKKFAKLNSAIASMEVNKILSFIHVDYYESRKIDDYSLVKFMPLDPTDEESLSDLLLQINTAIQYGEDLEPKEPKNDGGTEDDS